MIRTKPYKGDTKKVAVILPEEILNMNNNAIVLVKRMRVSSRIIEIESNLQNDFEVVRILRHAVMRSRKNNFYGNSHLREIPMYVREIKKSFDHIECMAPDSFSTIK